MPTKSPRSPTPVRPPFWRALVARRALSQRMRHERGDVPDTFARARNRRYQYDLRRNFRSGVLNGREITPWEAVRQGALHALGGASYLPSGADGSIQIDHTAFREVLIGVQWWAWAAGAAWGRALGAVRAARGRAARAVGSRW